MKNYADCKHYIVLKSAHTEEECISDKNNLLQQHHYNSHDSGCTEEVSVCIELLPKVPAAHSCHGFLSTDE